MVELFLAFMNYLPSSFMTLLRLKSTQQTVSKDRGPKIQHICEWFLLLLFLEICWREKHAWGV